jgi:hypothetical protein
VRFVHLPTVLRKSDIGIFIKVKNNCLFPEIAFIAKLLPMLEHLVKDAPETKKHKLSDHGWPEG